MPADIEVYVRESDVSRLVRWGGTVLPELRPVHAKGEETVLHDREGRAFCLSLGTEETDFTSLAITTLGEELPFASDLELARAVHGALSVEVRCTPGSLAPAAAPSQWWSVSGNGERLVEWCTPIDLADPARWAVTWRLAGATLRPGLFDELIARYREPQRAYHNVLHICESYSALDDAGIKPASSTEIEIALWFHDAIYDTRRTDNEERSAAWAHDELIAGGAAAGTAERVRDLVLATRHREDPGSPDACALVDADLSILGAPPDRFAAYERQIREEYSWVPEPQFREARGRFLRGMLARPAIFQLTEMRTRHEAHARRNLGESLRQLEAAAG